MSNTLDRGYHILRDADAFFQRLGGNKLLKAQERLAFGLIRRSSLLHRIAPRSGIGPEHFPVHLQSLIVAATTKTHEQILEIITSQPQGEIANAYRKCVELSEGEALRLAKQIVHSLAREKANGVDNKPTTEPTFQPKQMLNDDRLAGESRRGITTRGVANEELPAKGKSGTERIREIVEQGEAGSLEPPRPLMRELPPADPYPIDDLGDFLARAARAIHDRVQAPLAICGQSVLAAATLAVQGHANVELPTKQTKPLSEFFVSVAASGERKTAVDEQALKPIRAREAELREKYASEILSYQNDQLAWEKAREKRVKDGKGDRTKIKAALDDLGPAPSRPLEPILTCGEPTYEGLCKLLAVGQPSVGIFAAEGGQFIGGHGMNDEAKLRTAAGLSLLWDGQTIDRIRAQDATLLVGRRVAMHLMAQPDVMAIWLGDHLLLDQGLLSRTLLTAPEPASGKRLWRTPLAESDAALNHYNQQLLEILRRSYPIALPSQNELAPRALPLSLRAQDVWIGFYNHVESRLRAGAELEPVQGLANKLPEHAARIAAVLTLCEDIDAPDVNETAMARGISLVQHYAAEALRLFGASQASGDLRDALQLLKWLRTTWAAPLVSLPDIYQLGPNSIRDAAKARRIVKILDDHGHLVSIPNGAEIGGVMRRQVWRIAKG